MNAASVYLDFSCQSHKFPSGKNNWASSIHDKIEDTEKCQFHHGRGGEESGNLRGWKTEQRDKTVESNLKPHGPEMACKGSTASRATPHITACLHSTGPLQSLTQGKQTISFELVAKKKPLIPPFHSERCIETVFLTQPQNPTTGWLRGNSTEDDSRQIVGWKKAHIFSKPKAWESGPLSLYFSVSGKQSPSHKGGQVYGALDGIRKTVHVACEANLSSISAVTVFMTGYLEAPVRLCWWSSHLQMDPLR